MSTYNLCFKSKIRKNNINHCEPQFYYIKVGFKGVKIIETCFRDDLGVISDPLYKFKKNKKILEKGR